MKKKIKVILSVTSKYENTEGLKQVKKQLKENLLQEGGNCYSSLAGFYSYKVNKVVIK